MPFLFGTEGAIFRTDGCCISLCGSGKSSRITQASLKLTSNYSASNPDIQVDSNQMTDIWFHLNRSEHPGALVLFQKKRNHVANLIGRRCARVGGVHRPGIKERIGLSAIHDTGCAVSVVRNQIP